MKNYKLQIKNARTRAAGWFGALVIFNFAFLILNCPAPVQHYISTSAAFREILKPGRAGPGDIIWLAGGTYIGPFNSSLAGTVAAPITIKPLPSQRVVFDCPPPTASPAPPTQWSAPLNCIHFIAGGDVILQKCYFQWSHTDRTPGKSLNDRYRPSGVVIKAPRITVEGCVFSNLGQALECYGSPGSILNGNLIYSTGWQDGQQEGTGHAFYIQNQTGVVQVKNNVVCNGFGYGIQAYAENAYLKGIHFTDNAAINCGAHSTNQVRKVNFFIGANGNDIPTEALLTNCYAWMPLNYSNGINFQLYQNAGDYIQLSCDGLWGVGGKTQVAAFKYPVAGLRNSRFYGLQRMIRLGTVTTNATCSSNQYWYNGSYTNHETRSQQLFQSSESGTFVDTASWIAATKETGSTWTNAGNPTLWSREFPALTLGPDQDGVGHLVVFNFTNAHNFSYTPSAALVGTNGTAIAYEIQNAQDAMAPPVAQGLWTSGAISIPLTNLTILQPTGSVHTALSHTNQINAYRLFFHRHAGASLAFEEVLGGFAYLYVTPGTAYYFTNGRNPKTGTAALYMWNGADGAQTNSGPFIAATNTVNVYFDEGGPVVAGVVASIGLPGTNSPVAWVGPLATGELFPGTLPVEQ